MEEIEKPLNDWTVTLQASRSYLNYLQLVENGKNELGNHITYTSCSVLILVICVYELCEGNITDFKIGIEFRWLNFEKSVF